MSDDRALELIANGLTEDIIALLARVPGFFVIARASSFAYSQQARRHAAGRRRIGSPLRRHRQRAQLCRSGPGHGAACRGRKRQPVMGGALRRRARRHARSSGRDRPPHHGRTGAGADQSRSLGDSGGEESNSVDAWSHFRRAAGAIATQGWNEESVAEALNAARGRRSRSTLISLWRARFSPCSTPLEPTCRLFRILPLLERHARDEAERAITIDPNASDVLGFAGCAFADIGEHERGVELSAPRTRT